MNVLLCETETSNLVRVADLLQQVPDVNVVSVARTGREVVHVLARKPVDVSIHSEDTIELSRFIRNAVRGQASPALAHVVASPHPTAPLLVRAHQFGFDNVIAVPDAPERLVSALSDVVTRTSTLSDHPVIKSLNLQPGALTRSLSYSTELEAGIAGLVGTGLSDRDIARTLHVTLQTVHNNVEQLLRNHQLTTRTQLAVLNAINWSIPDYARS